MKKQNMALALCSATSLDENLKVHFLEVVPNKLNGLQTEVEEWPWHSEGLREEALKELTTMSQICNLTLKSGSPLDCQLVHHKNFLYQIFFRDFLAKRGVEGTMIDQQILKAGGRRIRISDTLLREEVWVPHNVNGAVPIPHEGIEFLSQIVENPVASSIVEQVGVIEVLERKRAIDPKLVVKVGGQWFQFEKFSWVDINTYGPER